METRRTNLPLSAPRLVGRDDDLQALATLFGGGAPLVTISGPAGVGKTQLARRYGRRWLDAAGPRGEAWFCDLSAARTAEDVRHAVLSNLSHSPPTGDGDAELEVVRALLARERLLLILDNFEQLVTVAGETVSTWVALAPIEILVTSRERLNLAGEQVHELECLSDGDALALLFERSRRGTPSHAWNDAELATALDVVQRLDRLPLAIELAAARLGVLSLEQLRDRLTERFSILTAASRDTPSRQHTLRSALDWSWDLLTTSERAALMQIALFRGGFTLEAAEAILSAPADHAASIIDLVQALVEKSLVHRVVQPDGRWRLELYESVREYALARQHELGNGEEASRRHATYFAMAGAGWVEGLDGPDFESCVKNLVEEAGNLYAAYERTVDVLPSVAARAILALHPISLFQGSLAAHMGLLDRAVSLAETSGDPGLLVEAFMARGVARIGRNVTLELALVDFERAEEWGAKAGRSDLVALALARRAYVMGLRGNVDDSRPLFERAIEMVRTADVARVSARVIHIYMGGRKQTDDCPDPSEMRSLEEEALELCRRAGCAQLEARILSSIGVWHADAGQLDRALECFERALPILVKGREGRHEAFSRNSRANVLHLLGRLEEARSEYQSALERSQELGLPTYEARSAGDLSLLLCESGDYKEALQLAERAVVLAEEWAEHSFLWILSVGRCTVLRAILGRHGGAPDDLRVVERLSTERLPFAWLQLVLRMLRAYIELIAEQRLAREEQRDPAPEQGRAAHAHLEEGRTAPPHLASLEARLVVRWLGNELARLGVAPELASAAPNQLAVGPKASWFQLDEEKRVDLSRRQIARRLLHALVRGHLDAPGQSLSRETLIDAGWPGEQVTPEAGAQRLWVAISGLRKMGLGAIITTTGGGYALAADLVLVADDLE